MECVIALTNPTARAMTTSSVTNKILVVMLLFIVITPSRRQSVS
jgi:hypothetical protein